MNHLNSEPASRWIWPFELKERIGEGGMGVVYRARYVVNDRQVAVKILPSDVKNPIVLARFERELAVLKTLKHPNIVRSFGGVCEDKQRFYAMELVEGGSLEDALQERGRFSWEQVVDFGKQMCAALAYLHQHGVVHRDVKPANFLIAENQQLKLSDFGLASVIAARRITTAGKTAGTILYMAPEQIRGGDITPQTDLYALGCVLYELLTGTPPFFGSTPAATMNMHCNSPIPRVTQAALDCPAILENLIERLLAKNPKDRPANAETVARELTGVTPTVSVVAKPRAIDSSLLKSARTPSTTGLEDRFKETREDLPSHAQQLWRWALIVCVAAIAGLSAWVFHLRPFEEVASQSEQLWIKAAQNSQLVVRVNALQSLSRLPRVSQDGIDAVTRSLSDDNVEVRRAAVDALGELRVRAQHQLGLLHKIRMNDPDPDVRAAAATAIGKIQANDEGRGGGWLVFLAVMAVLITAGVVWGRKSIALLVHSSGTPQTAAATKWEP